MSYYLGIDTSNYTTSAAVFDSEQNLIYQQKLILPVKNGTLGLKQSDAVFSHVKQLDDIIKSLFKMGDFEISAVGVSTKPRDVDGSYMPCFLVGGLVANSVGAIINKPVYSFSHQCGHIFAALYSTNNLELYKKPFIAFHFSGGTSECLLCNFDREKIIDIKLIAASDDLKVGQAIDRVGLMLGFGFPSGAALEKLALQSDKTYKIKPTFKGLNPSVSGLENKCRDMHERGENPCDTAKYCIDYISSAVEIMTENAIKIYGNLPIIYSGGVMSNSIIRKNITAKYSGYFAEPIFSCDNAVGTAILASIKGGL